MFKSLVLAAVAALALGACTVAPTVEPLNAKCASTRANGVQQQVQFGYGCAYPGRNGGEGASAQ